MRLFLFLSLLIISQIAIAQDCDWSSEIDGDVPAIDTTGDFNLLTCPGNLVISGNFNFNNVAGIDVDKPAMIEVNGNMTIASNITLSVDGASGGNGTGTGNVIGGAGNLSGASGGGITFQTPEDGLGYPKPPATPIGEGAGKPGGIDIGATPGSGGGGANFLDSTGAPGTSTGVAGGAEGTVVTSFNFQTGFFGGNGGGAGGQGNNSNDDGGGGGAGAGAIKLKITGNLILNSGSKITATGGNGGTGQGQGAGGGAGSGGAIFIIATNDILINTAVGTSINALGGTGGSGGATGVSGGNGGNGVIRIEYGGVISGSGNISPSPTLVDTTPSSSTQSLQKFNSDISCAIVPRQKVPATFWQIILGFGMALVLIKRKKTT